MVSLLLPRNPAASDPPRSASSRAAVARGKEDVKTFASSSGHVPSRDMKIAIAGARQGRGSCDQHRRRHVRRGQTVAPRRATRPAKSSTSRCGTA